MAALDNSARLELSESRGSMPKYVLRLKHTRDFSIAAFKKSSVGLRVVHEERGQFEFHMNSLSQRDDWFSAIEPFVRFIIIIIIIIIIFFLILKCHKQLANFKKRRSRPIFHTFFYSTVAKRNCGRSRGRAWA